MWFDISVYDVVLVGERQCCGDLLRKYYDFRICHRPLLMYIITQRLSFDQLHHYVVDIAFSAYIIYIYDIGMRQACCSLRLPPETVYKFMVVYELRFQNLYCYETVQQLVLCFVNNGHAALSDPFEQLVSARKYLSGHVFLLKHYIFKQTTVMLSLPPASRALSTSSQHKSFMLMSRFMEFTISSSLTSP